MGFINRVFRSLPKKKIIVGEPERIEFKSTIVQRRTEDCEYPILERELLPEKVICVSCGKMTLEGLEFCERCGFSVCSAKEGGRYDSR